MYTSFMHIRLLIALLKSHGITHLVLSPGARSIPFVRSVENDADFICHSVVDKRSAAFFALGLSLESGKPVGIACTSSTATCNYYSAVVEAYYQQIPLLLLTFDRDPYMLGQMENQMINQKNMYGDYCRISLTLPEDVTDERDIWYCQRIINEGLLELNHRNCGPVQINIPVYKADTFHINELPSVRKMSRLLAGEHLDEWKQMKKHLYEKKRILFILGQNRKLDSDIINMLERFAEQHDCVIAVEHMANIKCKYALSIFSMAETMSSRTFKHCLPDLIISYGGNISSRLKDLLKERQGELEHWLIREDGKVIDIFKNLTVIFETSLKGFLQYYLDDSFKNIQISHNYYALWKEYQNKITIPNIAYSNFYIAQQLADKIEKNSIIHTGILNSTRHMNFFELNDSVEFYSNIGAYGIDGTLSTFLGQSVLTDKKCYLLLGDLSFLYDMNALSIRNLQKNVRIIVVNNGGGAEFHFIMGKERIPTINKHISAEHSNSFGNWIKSLGYQYYSAYSKNEFDEQLELFINYCGETPAILEVYTDMETDAQTTRSIYNELRQEEWIESVERNALNLGKKALHSWQRKHT